MKAVFELIASPLFATYFVIFAGALLGKIKIYRFSLNISAVLICALLYGIILSACGAQFYTNNSGIYFSMLSGLGTMVFAAAVGIGACFALSGRMSEKLCAILCGGVMSAAAGIFTALLIGFDPSLPLGMALGILSGSMTSTPALAAACDLEGIGDMASSGYGICYFFGVVLIVLVVQIFKRGNSFKANEADESISQRMSILTNLAAFAVAVLSGIIIGGISVSGFSLGNSGGILISGLITGFCFKKGKFNLSESFFSSLRSFGLVLFFAGAGIPAGTVFTANFNVRYIIYGLGVSAFALLSGVLVLKLLNISSRNRSLTILSGGMTSTPAVSMLGSKTSADFSFAYISALTALVFCVRLLYAIFK